LQPLWNVNFISPEGCKIEILNGSGFFLFLYAKSGMNHPRSKLRGINPDEVKKNYWRINFSWIDQPAEFF
jgi:hypothetical protein